MESARWEALMHELGLPPSPDTCGALERAHREKHRFYHDARHVDHCLAELDAVRHLADEPAEIEVALWFHDAVYKPMAKDNEEASARWAVDFLTQQGIEPSRIARVRGLILATRHESVPDGNDARLLVDIDLSILGADDETYARFESDVRKEYRWVPGPLYRRGRLKILGSFLERDSVYATTTFRERLEERARRNLRHAIDELTGR